MKLVGLREAKQGLNALVAHAQKERVLLTRHGRPAALLIGVEGQDLETIMLAADARFWSWVEARRREPPSVSLADLAHDPAFRRLIEERRTPGAKLVSHETLLSRAREELATYRAGTRAKRPRRKR